MCAQLSSSVKSFVAFRTRIQLFRVNVRSTLVYFNSMVGLKLLFAFIVFSIIIIIIIKVFWSREVVKLHIVFLLYLLNAAYMET